MVTPFWEIEEVAYESIPDDQNPELEKQLDRFKLEASKDGKHFAFGVDGQVHSVYHIYGKNAFTRPTDIFNTEKTFAEINLESYEEPRTMLISMLEDGQYCSMGFGDDNVLKILNDLPVDDEMQLVALSHWPECYLTKEYLTDEKIKQLSTNAAWKAKALEQALFTLTDERVSFMNADEGQKMLDLLDDPQAFAVLDTFYATQFGHSGRSEANKYVEAAYNGSGRKLTPEGVAMLKARADEHYNMFMEDGETNHDFGLDYVVRFYVWSGENEKIDALIERSLYDVEFFMDENFRIGDALFDNFLLFSPSQQEKIRTQFVVLFPQVKDYMKDTMFDNAEGIVACEQLKTWLTEYPDDLKHADLPDGCQPQ